MRELERALRLEELADESIGKNKHGEAILHLTKAIQLQPKNPRFYDKRSSVFFMMKQTYYAYQDAQELINLEPHNPAGYCKKASIEYDTGNYRQAIATLRQSNSILKKENLDLDDLLDRCHDKLRTQQLKDQSYPWIASAIGFIFGASLVVFDYFLYQHSGFLRNPLLKATIIISNAYIFFRTLQWYRRYLVSYRNSLLEPPLLLDDKKDEAKKRS